MTHRTWMVVMVTVACSACARPSELAPLRVRASDLGTLPASGVAPGRAVIIEVREGEVVPLDVTVDGDLVRMSQSPPVSIPLVAKRTFFVRLSGEGLALSADGERFDEPSRAKGSFRFGVSATRDKGLRGEIVVRTPQR